MAWFLVGIGGALGSMMRHGLNHLIHQRNLPGTVGWSPAALPIDV